MANSHGRRKIIRLLRDAGLVAVKKSETSELETEKERANRRTKQYFLAPISRFWQLIVGLSIVLGLGLAFYQLRPEISLEPYKALDPANPFTEQFTAQNNSVYSLYDVRSGCFLVHVRTSLIEMNNVMFSLSHVANELSPKDSASVSCGALSPGTEEADLLIDIQFSTRWFQSRKTIRHRFVARKNSDNVVEWLHAPSPNFDTIAPVLDMPRPPIQPPPSWDKPK